jgi:acetyl esterase
MPLHPDAEAFLARTANMPQPYNMTIEEFRAQAAVLIPSGIPLEIGRVENVTIAGGDGQDLGLRIYVPDMRGPFPTIVWMHGGSFTRGTLDMFDPLRRLFAKDSRCAIVAVDQRLSPEARFPKPLEDGYAAVRWAVDHIERTGGDRSLVGVAGESSGGNLAAAVVLLARQRGELPVAFQLLVAPTLDPSLSSPSMSELGEGYLLTRAQLRWAFEQYAPGIAHDEPLLSALSARDLSGTVPTGIITIEYDPTRDEGEAYARALWAQGVNVRVERIAGYIHHLQGPDFTPAQIRVLSDLLADIRFSRQLSGYC